MTPVVSIAIDSEKVRGANNGGTRIHLLAGTDHTTGAVLVQLNVSEKHNEITYFQSLLEGIKDLVGVLFSAEAWHTQRGHAEFLHSRKVHYVLTVKANQLKLHEQLCALPWKLVRVEYKTHETSNGREIQRTVKCVSVASGIKFPHAAQE